MYLSIYYVQIELNVCNDNQLTFMKTVMNRYQNFNARV